MATKKSKKLTGHDIRAAFVTATQEVSGPFDLKGRGAEARCTFDRRLSAYLRGVDIPHVNISGYGANKHYPRRLVERAATILNESLGRKVIVCYENTFYVDDEV